MKPRLIERSPISLGCMCHFQPSCLLPTQNWRFCATLSYGLPNFWLRKQRNANMLAVTLTSRYPTWPRSCEDLGLIWVQDWLCNNPCPWNGWRTWRWQESRGINLRFNGLERKNFMLSNKNYVPHDLHIVWSNVAFMVKLSKPRYRCARPIVYRSTSEFEDITRESSNRGIIMLHNLNGVCIYAVRIRHWLYSFTPRDSP